MKCDRGEQESTERTLVHHSPAVMFKLWGTGESKGAAIRLACLLALACDTQLYQTSECTRLQLPIMMSMCALKKIPT